MATRRLGVSEARRLLPSLLDSIAAGGGRIEITKRGLPGVTLIRTADLAAPPTADALRVELLDEDADLVATIRELRSRVSQSRPAPRVSKKTRRSP